MKQRRIPRFGRIRLQPYIEADLAHRLAEVSAARGLTETAVLQNAIRQHIEGTRDDALLLRRMNRLDRALRRVHRDIELQFEAFAIWVKLWFAHTPNVAEDAK